MSINIISTNVSGNGYFKDRKTVRYMEVCLNYPTLSTNEQILDFFKTFYPNDKKYHTLCLQNRHKWDNYK